MNRRAVLVVGGSMAGAAVLTGVAVAESAHDRKVRDAKGSIPSTPQPGEADTSSGNIVGNRVVAGLPESARAGFSVSGAQRDQVTVYVARDVPHSTLDELGRNDEGCTVTFVRVKHSEAQILALADPAKWPESVRRQVLGDSFVGVGFAPTTNSLAITVKPGTTWDAANISRELGVTVTKVESGGITIKPRR